MTPRHCLRCGYGESSVLVINETPVDGLKVTSLCFAGLPHFFPKRYGTICEDCGTDMGPCPVCQPEAPKRFLVCYAASSGFAELHNVGVFKATDAESAIRLAKDAWQTVARLKAFELDTLNDGWSFYV